MEPAVIVENVGGVRVLWLNRPTRLNAADMRMLSEFREGLRAAESDETVGALLLAGKGRSFCVGDDIDAQRDICAAGEEAIARQVALLQEISERLMFSRLPVVGAVQGWAIGAGFSWAANCDFGVWEDTARARLPEISYGTFVGGGVTHLLPLQVGYAFAREMIFLGEPVSAVSLYEKGLVTRVVPAGQSFDEALKIASTLASSPRVANRSAKASLVACHEVGLRRALREEHDACIVTMRDPDVIARMQTKLAKAP